MIKVLLSELKLRWANILWFFGCILLTFFGTVFLTSGLILYTEQGGKRLPGPVQSIATTVITTTRTGITAISQLINPPSMFFEKQQADSEIPSMPFPAKTDPGYLLLPGIDRTSHKYEISLLRISDGKELAHWAPDWDGIYSAKELTGRVILGGPHFAQAIHPLVMGDGDLIMNTGQFFTRVRFCTSETVWVSKETGHHSLEFSADGNILALSVSDQSISDSNYLNRNTRNDEIIKLSPEGKVIQEIPFGKVLIDNGLSHLLFGHTGQIFQPDPIHLNQVSEATTSSNYWQKGDLLISARHMSTVFIYRPSTAKVIWHKSGPWMNQHDTRFVDDHRISVFDNNSIASGPEIQDSFRTRNDFNKFEIYDFANDTISEPFAEMLGKMKPRSISEGRAQLLDDGGLFFEETNRAHIMRFSQSGLLWEKSNTLDNGKLGAIGWSRYLTQSMIPDAILNGKCAARS